MLSFIAAAAEQRGQLQEFGVTWGKPLSSRRLQLLQKPASTTHCAAPARRAGHGGPPPRVGAGQAIRCLRRLRQHLCERCSAAGLWATRGSCAECLCLPTEGPGEEERHVSACLFCLLLFGSRAGLALGSPRPPAQSKGILTRSSCLSAEPRFTVTPAANLSFPVLRAACSSLNILQVLMTF